MRFRCWSIQRTVHAVCLLSGHFVYFRCDCHAHFNFQSNFNWCSLQQLWRRKLWNAALKAHSRSGFIQFSATHSEPHRCCCCHNSFNFARTYGTEHCQLQANEKAILWIFRIRFIYNADWHGQSTVAVYWCTPLSRSRKWQIDIYRISLRAQ